jgi:pimeloyl-ACP methyl ester carboxylesterase
MKAKPTVVLVHGFWGGAAHWSKVITELSHKGYHSIHAVEMPLTSLADDAERTRKMVAQQQGPVLLVGHSYGGAVLSEMGNQPNVVGLVYIAAFAPDAGESPEALPSNIRQLRRRTWRRTATAIYGLRQTNSTKASVRICLLMRHW